MTEKYKTALEIYLGKLNALGPVKERDRMAAEVLAAVNDLYTSPGNDIAALQRKAVKLVGAFAYLSLKAAKLKAEADYAEEAAKAARSGIITAYTTDPKMNVTRARAIADGETLDDVADARIRELDADEFGTVADVAEKTISLIQSILRGLEGERRSAGRFTT